jgi:hypothetical protein
LSDGSEENEGGRREELKAKITGLKTVQQRGTPFVDAGSHAFQECSRQTSGLMRSWELGGLKRELPPGMTGWIRFVSGNMVGYSRNNAGTEETDQAGCAQSVIWRISDRRIEALHWIGCGFLNQQIPVRAIFSLANSKHSR